MLQEVQRQGGPCKEQTHLLPLVLASLAGLVLEAEVASFGKQWPLCQQFKETAAQAPNVCCACHALDIPVSQPLWAGVKAVVGDFIPICSMHSSMGSVHGESFSPLACLVVRRRQAMCRTERSATLTGFMTHTLCDHQMDTPLCKQRCRCQQITLASS